MDYVYHAVPQEMNGTKIVPINILKQKNPELYESYLSKYKGREEIQAQTIPLFDCTWGDVVQTTSVHPQKIWDAQKEMGIDSPALPKEYYKIPINALDKEKTAIFLKDAPGEKYIQYKWLEDTDISSIQEVPPSTLVYYKMSALHGDTPFNFQFIPHVFYAGEIDVSGVEIIRIG